MRVPLTVADFLARGETAFAQSTAVVDDPDQPAAPVPTSSFQELGSRVRAWQAGLDALGLASFSEITRNLPQIPRFSGLNEPSPTKFPAVSKNSSSTSFVTVSSKTTKHTSPSHSSTVSGLSAARTGRMRAASSFTRLWSESILKTPSCKAEKRSR